MFKNVPCIARMLEPTGNYLMFKMVDYKRMDIETDLLYITKQLKKSDRITIPVDENHKENELTVWLEEQEKNYHPDISNSKGMLRNPEYHKLYTEFINDPKYSK